MTTSVESILNVVREIDSKKSQDNSDQRLIELHKATGDFMTNQGKDCSKEELVEAMKSSIISEYSFKEEVPKDVKRYLWMREKKHAVMKSWENTSFWRPALVIGAVCLISGVAYAMLTAPEEVPAVRKTAAAVEQTAPVIPKSNVCSFVIVSYEGKKTGVTRMKRDQTCYYVLCKAYKDGSEYKLDVKDYEIGTKLNTSFLYVGVSNEYYQYLRSRATSNKPISGETIPEQHLTGHYLRDTL